MAGTQGPNWSEFTASLNAFRAEMSDGFDRIQSQIDRNSDEVRAWVVKLNEETAKDGAKEVERLDKRINELRGVGIGMIIAFLGAAIGFIIDILKLKLFP